MTPDQIRRVYHERLAASSAEERALFHSPATRRVVARVLAVPTAFVARHVRALLDGIEGLDSILDEDIATAAERFDGADVGAMILGAAMMVGQQLGETARARVAANGKDVGGADA